VPENFLSYLRRYRQYRGLSSLPASDENQPIIEKLRGRGGMTARQLSRLVQEVFDQAYEQMKAQQGQEEAQKFKEVTTHWLRHTGASLEIERGRALKDVSEDLGHSSMATTDTVYVQTDDKKRASSGKNRQV
jgi:integrase